MKKTKNIIFDLGGVLLNLDFPGMTKAFQELGFVHFEEMYSQFKIDQFFEKLEIGAITDKEFYTVLQQIGNTAATHEHIKVAWNSLLLDFRDTSLDFLKDLKKDFNVYLLSNTNAIHFEAFNATLQKQIGLTSLDGFFLKSYYSHLLGLRKPNNDIFEFVLKDAGITASETFFIDDTKSNIVAAKKMGFKTHQLLPDEKIESLQY